MNDSADIKLAADRLGDAIGSLETTLGPMLSRITKLEKMASESQNFEADRAELARQLDQSESRAVDFEARESEFQEREKAFAEKESAFEARETEIAELAAETRRELDHVISQVRAALGQE